MHDRNQPVRQPFTVVLITPDFLAGQYGEGVALVHGTEPDAEKAAEYLVAEHEERLTGGTEASVLTWDVSVS